MIKNTNLQDTDPIESQEWREALDSIIKYEGKERAQFILQQLWLHARKIGVPIFDGIQTQYVNTIPTSLETKLPKNEIKILQNLTNYMRWNALVMVMRANQKKMGLGGHLSSYASMATLVEVGLNYFFHANDLVFFQGHSSEGIYARAFLEGRLSEEELIGFRQETFSKGISSYPHPYLMPHFWQFPTVSMGLGPLMAIYQAQLLKYLNYRGLVNTDKRKVWVFCGDGETGEPEALGSLLVASRERLDNLIFIINCNLQRLDGPVSSNGNIIQELEGIFLGAGWRVIKVIWGHNWEKLFQKDTSGLLLKCLSEMVDGEYQACRAKGGAYLRACLLNKYYQLKELMSNVSDYELEQLMEGGHDPQKVYSAYTEALKEKGKPTALLIKTVKGYGYGREGESLNITHNLEAISEEGLKLFRNRFALPLSDEEIKDLKFYKPMRHTPELQYLQRQREKLGGPLPVRNSFYTSLKVPGLSLFSSLLSSTNDRAISTGMAFSRIIGLLLKDENIKERIVPIVADEARTLGLEGLFRQIGIFSIKGQQYVPEDIKKLVCYHESQSGQTLQQGISEAGAMSSWIAAATSFANNSYLLIPFYVYYAMFGYQRVGDLVWAAADMQSRGFILGGLAGKTTLPGEGLQHQDSHNLLMFSMIPTCRAYDPVFSYELAVIIQDGLQRMYQNKENTFYYITLMNENYPHPQMPTGAEKGIIKGMYLFKEGNRKLSRCVQLLGAGAIFREVIIASEILEDQFNVAADIWSVPGFNLLRHDIESVDRYNRLHFREIPKKSYVEKCLNGREGPVIAATDYIKLLADQIGRAIKRPYYVLGTDGFGRSDTRSALRDFFEVDAKMIVYTALKALADQDKFTENQLVRAVKKLGINLKRPDPWTK
ncbi:pyruvate dehydrogenase (acetyl-transferring), homodimeric type [Coxiella endosymbiont of Amblyomma americanum]|uniref:pyruvate dehydrogenase (acetyl-transferring), homodimeric type n=1 Tax=Coxiella endosymbiont of Amblyomma americanum TaxID=325775 RepID=UPI00057DA686|nr:pyruvate dehydrogenase (acetyl-transferring), homodimeric type [Coxiella endosymbiont of Amblyomma americanum]AJC50498.1 pyruvate dehydrogenase [Coxiella endosymbiont of Amblyomma americanum]AUJ58835.1 pyruvate dehydrogenase (acetyl-transferring), homodimeric type [Coxiella-like endosymbiont of Amblyomma americanum]